MVQIEWDEVPHLSDKAKTELLASIPPYQREARSKGVPVLGAGAIYPVAESDFVIDPFELPEYFPRCYGLRCRLEPNRSGMDGSRQRDADHYLYHEYYVANLNPSFTPHPSKRRRMVPGLIDPASLWFFAD